ncbi:ATP-binding cassette domain-containing protein [Flexivirga aerilata]|uniref:ATP-binding cassette domain-containing protein n=1 Tax=Flexivirga aerilata TaxID=1656889 RepID=UPI00248354C1|nr:ABC transporter ATP-binding protein [Flexivirga aerilata]
MLRIEGLVAGWGSRTVLHDVTVTVPAGAFTAVVGPNGSGKFTLLATLFGGLTPYAGTVRLGSTTCSACPRGSAPGASAC